MHAYDSYMNKLLQTLLEFHAAAGGTAILLSATLPDQVRQAFADAFDRGMDLESPSLELSAFPLVTRAGAIPGDASREYRLPTEESSNSRSGHVVNVEFSHSEEDVVSRLVEAADAGKCACWIRNTVTDARDGYDLLADSIADERLDLFHSRFARNDRAAIERDVLDRFGKEGGEDERSGRIVVATQVIEQSLDLDFDFMVSDLAPVDLLIQRAGRLHRHARDVNGRLLDGRGTDQRERGTLMVHAPEFTESPAEDWFESKFPGPAYVYPDAGKLWLTMRILRRQEGIRIPEEARLLVESVYGEEAQI